MTALQEPTKIHTIVVGAGPAGLAMGACLQRAGVAFLILEQAEQVAVAWRRHYERLHLHTDKKHSELPFAPFPREYPRYPSRLQMIDYLEAYALRFQLAPRLGQRVVSARRMNGSWEVRTQDTQYQATTLVIATGNSREPSLATWPGEESFQGRILHSSEYREGEAFRGQKVLVVGFGNSGGEIAIDLWEHGAEPSLAVRSPVNVIPRDLFGIPILAIGILQSKLPPRWADALNAPLMRVVMGDLTRYGLRKAPQGPLTQIRRDGRIPLIDVGTIRLIKNGQVKVHPGIERFTDQGVLFSDGEQRDFDAVVLATGYLPRVDAFLEGAPNACDDRGTPLFSGAEAPLPGLYFCGFHVAPTGMLREIAQEARQISAAIAGAGGENRL
jgi:indole-3-pyruvate monooxygenase